MIFLNRKGSFEGLGGKFLLLYTCQQFLRGQQGDEHFGALNE